MGYGLGLGVMQKFKFYKLVPSNHFELSKELLKQDLLLIDKEPATAFSTTWDSEVILF